MKYCKVCGARVYNINPKVFTCDAICTRAQKSNRSRTEQLKVDLEADDREFWSTVKLTQPSTLDNER